MSYPHLKSFTLALLLALGLMAGPAEAANQASPKLPAQKARVAQGGQVELAASMLSAVQLARLRPGYETLKPRARTNAE